MNIFITSLMHPSTAKDFESVKSNFLLNLKSVCGQSNQDFKYIVVCNEIPEINFERSNIEYFVVDFPPLAYDDTKGKRQDKAAKLVVGLLFAKNFDPDYVYFCDADDWVVGNINEFLVNNSSDTGFLVNKGYFVDVNKRKYLTKFGLYRFCGSTHAIKYSLLIKLLGLDSMSLSVTSTKQTILDLLSDYVIFSVLDGHGYKKFFKDKGFSFDSFPFAAVAWVRNTGNNIREDAQHVPGLAITERILNKFSLQSFGPISKNSITDYLRFFKLATVSWFGNKVKGDHR